MKICANDVGGLEEQYRAAIDEWLDRMTHIEQDLTKTLRIPHNRFWSHALYDDGFHQLLESYLRLAPRYTELHRYLITKEMEDVEDRVYKLVFRNFLRLSTYKESKVNHIDKGKFAELLYDNYIFDIPKIFDLCILFQRGNHNLVCRMIENIMSCQQKFTSDLKDIEDTILMAFERAVQSIQVDDDDEFETLPRRLDDLEKGSELTSMPFWKLVERVTYVVDIAASLLAFFEVYPLVAKIFSLETVGPRLASFFDSTFPVLKEELIRRNKLKNFEPVFTMLKKRLSYAKTCILNVFRCLLQHSCIQPLIDLGVKQEKSTGQELPYLESFFAVICNCLTEKHFIFAYQQRYPVEDDIAMFDQYRFFGDNTRVLYVLQSISMVYAGLGCTPPTNLSKAQDMASKPKPEPKIPPFCNAKDNRGSSSKEEGACGGGPSTSSVAADQNKVENLKELFPDMPLEFLQRCLEYYNNSYEEVVLAMLDGNLPPSLNQPEPESSRLSTFEARSIYDNDEFDILRRDDVDLSRIHIGKKSKTPKSLDEKGHDKVLKEVYEKYSIIHEDVAEDAYDDEYDDTYDSNDVGLEETAHADELTTRRPFTVPRVLQPKQGRRNADSRHDDNGGSFEEEEEWHPPRDQFVANPAEIREQREQRHREMMERRGPPRQRNVRGGPRGQGQSREVLRDRQMKERHSSGGHNQRAQADHKRNRGMFS